MHGQFDAAVSAEFALHAGHMGLHGAFLDPQLDGYFAIRPGRHDQFEDLEFAVSEQGLGTQSAGLRDTQEAVNKAGKEAARRPDRSADHNVNGLADRPGAGIRSR